MVQDTAKSFFLGNHPQFITLKHSRKNLQGELDCFVH